MVSSLEILKEPPSGLVVDVVAVVGAGDLDVVRGVETLLLAYNPINTVVYHNKEYFTPSPALPSQP